MPKKGGKAPFGFCNWVFVITTQMTDFFINRRRRTYAEAVQIASQPDTFPHTFNLFSLAHTLFSVYDFR